MRNALICAGAMLAISLLWPLVFGAGSAAVASDVALRGPSTVTMVIPEARAAVALPRTSPVPVTIESCVHRYQREHASCAGKCEAAIADAADVCEATGFWPE